MTKTNDLKQYLVVKYPSSEFQDGGPGEATYEGSDLNTALVDARDMDHYLCFSQVFEIKDGKEILMATYEYGSIEPQLEPEYSDTIKFFCTIEAGMKLRKEFKLKPDEHLPDEAWASKIYINATKGLMPW